MKKTAMNKMIALALALMVSLSAFSVTALAADEETAETETVIESNAEAPAAESKAEAPAESKAEAPAAESKAEAPAAETKTEAAPAESKAEAPAAESKTEAAPAESKAESKAEAPAAESKTETPAAESKAEAPAAESKAETPAAESKAEAPAAAETKTETPAAETKAEIPAAEIKTEAAAAETETPAESKSEAPAAVTAPVQPEEPVAPQEPDLTGLSDQMANERISAYNAQVESYNESVAAYNQAMEEYQLAVEEYNRQAQAYNEEAEIYNAAAEEHNAAEDEKQAASDAKMAEYEKKLDVYNKNVAAIERLDKAHSEQILPQMETLGNIGRVDKETITQLGTVLEDDYCVNYGRRQVRLGKAGDLVIRWEDLQPTADHKTIAVVSGESSGNTYKVANLHVFEDFADMYEMAQFQAENGYDCMNINIDDQAGVIIIPAAMIERLVMMEFEVAEVDANDTVTVTSQNAVFSSTPNLMTPRFLEGYTQGSCWYNSSVFSHNAATEETDWTGTSHTFTFADGTCDYSSIKNPLNVNEYFMFARYNNPMPVKPETYEAQRMEQRGLLSLLEAGGSLLSRLNTLALRTISVPVVEPADETPAAPVAPETPETPVASETPETPAAPETPVAPEARPVLPEIVPPVAPVIAETAPKAPVVPVVRPVRPTETPVEEILPETVPLAAPETESVPAAESAAIEELGEELAPLVAFHGTETLEEVSLPAANARGWALLNLIACVLTALIALGMVLTLRQGEEREIRLGRLLGLIPAASSALVFVLTENMKNPMVLTDRWTILMVAILAVGAALALLTRDARKDETAA